MPARAPSGRASAPADATNTAVTNATSRTIDGKAMRRRRVKISDRNQAGAATNRAGAKMPKLAANSDAACAAENSAPAIEPTAINRMITPMVTKMSLKLVTRRKLSSSLRSMSRCALTCARNPAAASALSAPEAIAELRSSSEYTGPSSLSERKLTASVLGGQYASAARATGRRIGAEHLLHRSQDRAALLAARLRGFEVCEAGDIVPARSKAFHGAIRVGQPDRIVHHRPRRMIAACPGADDCVSGRVLADQEQGRGNDIDRVEQLECLLGE